MICLNLWDFQKGFCMKTLLQMKLESHSDYESMLKILTSTLKKGNSEGGKVSRKYDKLYSVSLIPPSIKNNFLSFCLSIMWKISLHHRSYAYFLLKQVGQLQTSWLYWYVTVMLIWRLGCKHYIWATKHLKQMDVITIQKCRLN